jgi:replicative DNA helicase
MADKILPANVQAEQALLGVVLKNNDVYSRVSSVVEWDHFFEPAHQKIWRAVSKLIEEGQTANPITCQSQFNGSGIGGEPAREYLSRLVATAAASTNAMDYAGLVKDLAVRRELIVLGENLSQKCYEAPVDLPAEKIFAEHEAHLSGIRPAVKRTEDYADLDDILSTAAQYASDVYRDGGVLTGLSTGLPRLDDVLGGLQPSDLIILAGRPGMGKTALATNIAFNIGRDLKSRRDSGDRTGVVAFQSLEMTKEQLGARILSEQSEVPFWKLRRKIAEPEEVERYVNARREITKLPIRVDDTRGLNIGSLRMRLRGIKKKEGLEIVLIDYLQLLAGTTQSKSRDPNRAAEVTEITGSLKTMAKELGVPIVALAQLSRQVENRPDNRPKLHDLRESGSIEQDADVVMFVYREEYYVKSGKPREGTNQYFDWEKNMRRVKGVAEVIIEKNRHGPTGSAILGFSDQITKFTNEPAEREPEPTLAGSYEEREEKKKPLRLPPKALSALGILRNMQLNDSVPNDYLPNVPSDVKIVVPYVEWRKRIASELMDAGEAADEKALAKFMEASVVPHLRGAQLIGRGGVAGDVTKSWVWLTPKGMK